MRSHWGQPGPLLFQEAAYASTEKVWEDLRASQLVRSWGMDGGLLGVGPAVLPGLISTDGRTKSSLSTGQLPARLIYLRDLPAPRVLILSFHPPGAQGRSLPPELPPRKASAMACECPVGRPRSFPRWGGLVGVLGGSQIPPRLSPSTLLRPRYWLPADERPGWLGTEPWAGLRCSELGEFLSLEGALCQRGFCVKPRGLSVSRGRTTACLCCHLCCHPQEHMGGKGSGYRPLIISCIKRRKEAGDLQRQPCQDNNVTTQTQVWMTFTSWSLPHLYVRPSTSQGHCHLAVPHCRALPVRAPEPQGPR